MRGIEDRGRISNSCSRPTKSTVGELTFVDPVYPVESFLFGSCCRERVEDVERVDEEEAYRHPVQVYALEVVWKKAQTACRVGDMFGDVQVCHVGG